MTQRSGPTVRLKLTLLYGALFLVTGLILISITYALLRRELHDTPGPPAVQIGDGLRPQGGFNVDDLDPEERESLARRDERRNALRQLWRQSILALLITGSGALMLGWLAAGRVLAPIRDITDHAQRASIATLDDRIALDGPPDELKELADTIDSMLDRLQAAFEAQRAFAAQASHELRTPLAIIRAETEVARNEPGNANVAHELDAVLVAVQRSEQLIDGLLALSRAESTMLTRERVDLAELTGDVAGEFAHAASEAGVRLDLELEPAHVVGDPALLSRLIGNLLQNAIQYNEPGGRVDTAVGVRADDAVLTVSNSGPLLAQTEIDALFRPFARGEWARRHRGGHGLGLAIVQAVAEAHGGRVSAVPGPEGGLTVTVGLPISAT